MFKLFDKMTLLALRLRLAHHQQVFDERQRAGRITMQDLLRLGHVSGDLIKFRRFYDAQYSAEKAMKP